MNNTKIIEILMVEDNPTDIKMILRVLSKKNLVNKVQVVRDGEEALDYIFAKGTYAHRNIKDFPRVIFLDLKLPKVNGIEVLREVKSHELTKVIPVVILTSSKEEPDIKECYSLGANSYIVKPVNFENFAESISNLGLYWVIMNEKPV